MTITRKGKQSNSKIGNDAYMKIDWLYIGLTPFYQLRIQEKVNILF